MAVAAWIAAYRLGCDKAGALVWCLAAGLASGPLYVVITSGTSDDFLRQRHFGLVVLLLLLAAALRFLWARRKAVRGPNTAAIVVAVFTLIIPAMVGSMISRTREDRADYQQATEVFVGLHRLAAEVETLRAARGRLPKDEAEFVAWRCGALPRLGRYSAVHYDKEEGDNYLLSSSLQHFWGRGWDMFGYDVLSRGPRSRERIQVELF